MQLKLRVGLGDTLTIDVQPTDTFQDLSDRLYSLGGVKVDLSQLQKSHDKPFNMSTNVIDYFLPSKEGLSDDNGKRRKLCRLCSQSILTNPFFLFEDKKKSLPGDSVTLIEKVNSSLPIHVSVHDPLPKQICENCHVKVNKGFDFMRKVVEAQSTLEQVYNVKLKDRPVTNYKEEGCCPLCTVGRFKQYDHRLKQSNGAAPTEKAQKKEVVIQVPKGSRGTAATTFKEPPPPTGPLSSFHIKEEPEEPDYGEDDIVTGYWDPSQELEVYGMKKVKKRNKNEDDHDWTIDEEYVPVSRRGRPRGTKNKPKVQTPVVEKSCQLCGWLGADVDMYAHAINQHCQPDMGYFPCPLCRTNQPNEMQLETHLDKHNAHNRKERN